MKILNDVNVNNNTRGFKWAMNTDGAEIFFKNDSDGDSDSYLGFRTFDNGNEYFKWDHRTSSGITEWMSLKSDGLRIGGNMVYHTNNKPTPSVIGAVNKAGDTMTGRLEIQETSATPIIIKRTGSSVPNLNIGFKRDSGPTAYIGVNGNNQLLFGETEDLSVGGNFVYHQGYKPSWNDVLSKPSGLYVGENSSLTFQEGTSGFDKTKSGFKRHNGVGGIRGGLALHVTHPDYVSSGAHSRGISFDYGSSGGGIFTYGFNDSGNKAFEYELYHTGFKPTPADIGAATSGHDHDSSYLPKGSWRISGQDLIVHNKRALVGEANGTLHLGYGNDFTNIKCGNGQTVWHSGNFNPDGKINTNASCNKNWNWQWGSNPTHLWGAQGSSQDFFVYSPNDLTVGNSNKVKGKNIFVQSGQPAAENVGDVWISW